MSSGIEPILDYFEPADGYSKINPDVSVSKPDFGKWLTEQLSELNTDISNADMQLRKLATGDTSNIHQVMLSLEKAKTAMELTVQVRNRLLESYQDIMRMQI